MRTAKFIKLALIVVTGMVLMGNLWAGAAQVKARMKARLSQIDAYKKSGVIGEGNTGYLVALKNDGKAKSLVAAENKDRKIVYQAIARKQRTSVDFVGKRRALQIIRIAKKGQWLQNAQGKWYRK